MLFIPLKFKTFIQLSSEELDANYQERILDKLKNKYEGKCSKFGFIKPNTLEIYKRSSGKFIKEHFNGYIKYDIICKGEVCNPIPGTIIQAIIRNKNQMGILAESLIEIQNEKIPILDIIIPIRSVGIISQIDLDTLQIGNNIKVEVVGKKYQNNDKKISIIGRVISSDVNDDETNIQYDEVEEELNEEEYENDIEEDTGSIGGGEDEEIKKLSVDNEDENYNNEDETEEEFEEDFDDDYEEDDDVDNIDDFDNEYLDD